MKKYMPLEGLRWSRDSGSALCDTSQNSRSRTGWGGNSVFCNIFNRKDNIVEFRKESCKGTLFEHHFSCFLSIYVCCVI